jgi:hypothetical protein
VRLKEATMLTSIHHVSYLVRDLGAAIDRHVAMFQGRETGRGAVAGLGLVGFVQTGDVEIEFIEPEDKGQLTSGVGYTLHHVAYAVDNLDGAVADFRARGYTFATAAPFTNFMGYRLIYFDPSCTNGVRIHLTDAGSLRQRP